MDIQYTLADGSQVPWYEVLRRAGYIPSHELWEYQEDDLPLNPRDEAWIDMEAQGEGFGAMIRPFRYGTLQHLLSMAPEDLPRALCSIPGGLERAVIRARLDGSLP